MWHAGGSKSEHIDSDSVILSGDECMRLFVDMRNGRILTEEKGRSLEIGDIPQYQS